MAVIFGSGVRLPATGLLRPIPFTVQFIPPPVMRLPFSLETPTPPLPRFQQSTLPEQPLKPSPLFGAENLAFALAALPAARSLRATVATLNTTRKLTVVYGKAKIDLPFYAALLASPFLTRKLLLAENQILNIPQPRTTVDTGSFLSAGLRNEPTQRELDALFNIGLFGSQRQIAFKRLELINSIELLRRRPGFFAEGTTIFQKRLDALDEAISFRPVILAQADIAASRALLLLSTIRARYDAISEATGIGGLVEGTAVQRGGSIDP